MTDVEGLLASMTEAERLIFDEACRHVFHSEPNKRRVVLSHLVA